MICFPNAKINLGLQVKNKREDGFHNIESVLVPIPFCDVLEFKTSKEFTLKSYGLPHGIETKNNILFKTWQILKEDCQIPPLEIHLLKNIPTESGLGGGSSDASFLIKSINETFSLGLESTGMQKIALEIGSDCPFFIENKIAFVEGRGEKVTQLNLTLKGLFLVLLKPTIGISTAEAYASLEKNPSEPLLKIISKPMERWKENLINDFEKPVFKIHPQLKKIKEGLYNSGAAYASMSGSGSSFFGIFNGQTRLPQDLQKQIVWSGFIPG